MGLLGGSKSKISKSLLENCIKWHIIENSSFCGGVGACAASFLDLDPPNNPTSHYGACHFGYNLSLRILCKFFSDYYSFETFWLAPQY